MAGARVLSTSAAPTGAALIAVVVWTVLILTIDRLRFLLHLPHMSLAIATVAVVIAFLTAALAYIRYSIRGIRSWMLLGVAFVVLGGNQLLFGILIDLEGLGVEAPYFWMAGRLLVGLLLLLAALTAGRADRDETGHARRFLTWAGGSLLVLASTELALWALRGSLPALAHAPPGLEGGVSVGIPRGPAPASIALGAVGALIYLLAAAAHVRQAASPPWLPAALVLAAGSHIHHMLSPTVFTDWVSTGDLLRVAFSAVLLVGLLWEVRRTFESEWERSVELGAAYARERQRVVELEALDRAKAELFSVLTHELLHPVAAIRGFAVTLKRRWDRLGDDVRHELVDRLDRESGRLRDMAEGAVTAIHLEDDAFSLLRAPLRPDEVVREAAAASGELQERLRVEVTEAAERVRIEADRARLLQVLRNLLSNAAKYSHPGTPITLRLEARNGRAVFTVEDRGPGIDPDQLPRIFERFSRIRPAGKEHVVGSGLGLYIARRIVEAHGGRIEASSTVGSGSSFRFEVPVDGPG